MGKIEQQLAIAATALEKKGATLTESRRQVLELLLEARQPLTAYKLIELLQARREKQVTPPIVYRALGFLVEHGLVHRLESLNAFIACATSDHDHASQFVLCSTCGRVEEMDDHEIAHLLQNRAAALGYTVQQQMIELRGLCAACRG
jgi:Fur family zinc uptake transcriptional regulator